MFLYATIFGTVFKLRTNNKVLGSVYEADLYWIRIQRLDPDPFSQYGPAEPTRNNVTLTANCSDGSNLISGNFFSLDDETLEACT